MIRVELRTVFFVKKVKACSKKGLKDRIHAFFVFVVSQDHDLVGEVRDEKNL